MVCIAVVVSSNLRRSRMSAVEKWQGGGGEAAVFDDRMQGLNLVEVRGPTEQFIALLPVILWLLGLYVYMLMVLECSA